MELKISILGLGLNILATFMLGDVLSQTEAVFVGTSRTN